MGTTHGNFFVPLMNVEEIYAKKINTLLSSSDDLEHKLTEAIEYYKSKIEHIRDNVLITEKSDLHKVYDSASTLAGGIEKYLSELNNSESNLQSIAPKAGILYNKIEPLMLKCNEIDKKVGRHDVQELLAITASGILAARVLSDKDILVESINQYLEFVHEKIDENSEYLSIILEQSDYNKTCLDSISYLLLEFDTLLKQLQFPVTVTDINEKELNRNWCDDSLKLFANEFRRLYAINCTYLNCLISNPVCGSISLPMQLILKSLEKRFRYHFCGTRITNQPGKPEWYMSQVLQWIRDNDYFLTIVDKDFIPNTEQTLSLRTEFMRGLVTLLLNKLNFDLGFTSELPVCYGVNLQLRLQSQAPNSDLPTIKRDENSPDILNAPEHFSHLIDVLLQTEARLSQLNYPFDQPRPTDILSNPETLSRWLLLEYKLAYERLNDLLEKPTGWKIVDDTDKRLQCVDDFIAILHAINMRGRQLNDRNSRLRFVQIQLKLIRKFFYGLVKQAIAEDQSKIETESNDTRKASTLGALLTLFIESSSSRQSSRWISVLNTLKHINDIMLEWSNDQYYISFWEQSATRHFLIHGDPWLEDIGLNDEDESPIETKSSDPSDEPTHLHDGSGQITTGLHGGVFTEVLRLYSHQINKMLRKTVKVAVDDLKCKSYNYIHSSDNWLRVSSNMKSLRSINLETSNLILSADASAMLLSLRNWLFHLSSSMHPKLFNRIWQEIASSLDNFLFSELVLSNRFSILGAAQLRFDLTNSVYPLFGIYTERPESYFARMRDAVIILNLLPGVAELLKDTLKESLGGRTKHSPLAPLFEIGVNVLTPEEVLRILDLRVYPE